MFIRKNEALSGTAVVVILMLAGVVTGMVAYGTSIAASYEVETGTNDAYEILTGEEIQKPAHTASSVYPLPGIGSSRPERTCIIKYESKTGLSLGQQEISGPEGTTITVSPKDFAGYQSPGSQEVKFKGGITREITFVYTPIKYSIAYNLNGGSVAKENKTSYTVEEPTFTLNNPDKVGFEFAGWTGSNGPALQEMVVVAKGEYGNKTFDANWDENTYIIKYHSNGGTGTMANETRYYTDSKALTANAFKKTGYTFTGWSLAANGPVKYTNKQIVSKLSTGEDVNLYAQWSPNTVKVTFDTGYDDIQATPSSKNVTFDAKYGDLPTPEIEGYLFLGWYTSPTSGSLVTEDTKVSNASAHTLYARWQLPTIDLLMMYTGSGVNKFGTFEKHAYEFDKGVTYTGQPIHGEWESFCIALSDLDVGATYQLKFDAALSDRTCIRDNTSYPIGCRIDADSSFAPSASNRKYTWVPTSASPSVEGFVIEFTATRETMFWQWELSKLRNPGESYGSWKPGVENYAEGYFDLTLNNVSLTKIS